MMRTLFLALTVVSLSATPALAAPCKDAKGKFIKCPEKKPEPAKKCRLNGKFAKCGTPGAKPA
jgi:hypothetical protein